MIYLKICGRLGNQMFQYAFAKKIQLLNRNDKIAIDFGDVDKYRIHSNDATWVNQLCNFKLTNYEEYNRKNIPSHISVFDDRMNIFQKLLLLIFRLLYRNDSKKEKIKHQNTWAPILFKFGIIANNHGYFEYKKTNAKNIFIKGFFEDPRYFADIREILLQEFTPKFDRLEKNSELYHLIENSNSVCISIRRGADFVQSDVLNVCDNDYFFRAVKEIQVRVDNPIFFVFSDEIEIVKQEFKIQTGPVYFEDGTDPVWEKLRLMYSCKHFIISNSTFSWWAQYLSKNDNKVVIAPLKWWNGDFVPTISERSWIQI